MAIARLRSRFGHWSVAGGHFVILALAVQAEDLDVLVGAVALIGFISLFAFFAALRRGWAVADTPTSRVASAAQGYVELCGQGLTLDPDRPLVPATGEPCLWYRQVTWNKRDKSWVRESESESTLPLLLEDGSGACLLLPEGADFLVAEKERIDGGASRHHDLWCIRPGQALYAIGQFETRDQAPPLPPAEPDASMAGVQYKAEALIEEWKKNEAALLARFDLDGNRRLDKAEWDRARDAAFREVMQRRAQPAPPPLPPGAVHTVSAPRDGRLYLISTQAPEEIASGYRFWAWVHLLLVFVGLAAGWWLWLGV